MFVSSLPPPTNGKFYSDGETAALRDHFEEHGALAMDPIFIGKSGSGYATYAKPASAQRAVSDKRGLHGARPKVVRSKTAQRPKKSHGASAPHVHAAAQPARPADGGWQGADAVGGDDEDDDGDGDDYYDDYGAADAGVSATATGASAAPAAAAASAVFPSERVWERKQPAPRPPVASDAPSAAEAGLWVRKVAPVADAPAREAQLKAQLKAKLLRAQLLKASANASASANAKTKARRAVALKATATARQAAPTHSSVFAGASASGGDAPLSAPPKGSVSAAPPPAAAGRGLGLLNPRAAAFAPPAGASAFGAAAGGSAFFGAAGPSGSAPFAFGGAPSASLLTVAARPFAPAAGSGAPLSQRLASRVAPRAPPPRALAHDAPSDSDDAALAARADKVYNMTGVCAHMCDDVQVRCSFLCLLSSFLLFALFFCCSSIILFAHHARSTESERRVA